MVRGQRASGTMSNRSSAPGHEIVSQLRKARPICFASGPDDHIPGRNRACELPPPQFPEPPAQTIAGHHAGLELRNNESHPGMTRLIVRPPHIEKSELPAPPTLMDLLELRCRVQPARAGEALSRQRPPCFEGVLTVRRLRPFFRRLDNVSRPHRSAIRARKPCLFRRLRLRGR
jgi:hypothetical protein